MATYFLDLFSPQTYEAFRRSPGDVSGFRRNRLSAAKRVSPGDRLVCYLTKVGRWSGILEVVEGPFVDDAPIFHPEDDPYVVRFKVNPLILLDVQQAIPIREKEVWEALTFTRELDRVSDSPMKLIATLGPLQQEDGVLLEALMLRQSSESAYLYPIDQDAYKKLAGLTVRRVDKDVTVSVPDDADDDTSESKLAAGVARESHQIQALIADIGAKMGMDIWVPRSDRGPVARERAENADDVLDRLPLNYDEATLSTIENIDVIWLRGRSIVRAFEVEHTTSVYSGLLRMADLLALQPNMDIRLHIVAPLEKRDKVFQEIRRPVFSLLEHGALAERCTYLSYDSLRELAQEKLLAQMRDSALDEFAEEAE